MCHPSHVTPHPCCVTPRPHPGRRRDTHPEGELEDAAVPRGHAHRQQHARPHGEGLSLTLTNTPIITLSPPSRAYPSIAQQAIAKTSLGTKVHPTMAEQLTPIVVEAVTAIQKPGAPINMHMVEMMSLEMQHRSETESHLHFLLHHILHLQVRD